MTKNHYKSEPQDILNLTTRKFNIKDKADFLSMAGRANHKIKNRFVANSNFISSMYVTTIFTPVVLLGTYAKAAINNFSTEVLEKLHLDHDTAEKIGGFSHPLTFISLAMAGIYALDKANDYTTFKRLGGQKAFEKAAEELPKNFKSMDESKPLTLISEIKKGFKSIGSLVLNK